MKKTKSILSTCLLVGALAVSALTGCTTATTVTPNGSGGFTTNTTTTADVPRIASVVQEGAYIGTLEAVKEDQKLRPDFILAAESLSILATETNISVANILQIVQQLPVSQLQSQTAQLSFEGATVAITALEIPSVPANAAAILQPIATALSTGITSGLNAVPLPPAPPLPATNGTSHASAGIDTYFYGDSMPTHFSHQIFIGGR